MLVQRKKRIVLLGMMTTMPVAGNIWLVIHYLEGLRRLGYDVYYVESHARTPSALMEHEHDDASAKAAAFIGEIMRSIDLEHNWAFHALHDDGQVYGMSDTQLAALYDSADLIINLHGGTVPLPEHAARGRLIYLETDPVELEIELYNNDQRAISFLEPHAALFSWGENYGRPDCKVPQCDRFRFMPTRAPVVLDLWQNGSHGEGRAFTTVGNWAQQWHDVNFCGEVYRWSKHFEFLKFIELPRRVTQPFELALSSYTEKDRQLLETHGWRVCHAMGFSADRGAYRNYLQQSRGEFTVAKDQNVRLRSGWFSERSAQYLAAGKPVVTQDTGFGSALPTGNGLFVFNSMDEIVSAVDQINSNYKHHSAQATEVAREYFNYDKVLRPMLAHMGL